MPSSWAAGSKPAAACFEPARLSKLASSHHSYLFSVQGDTAGGRLTEAEFRPAGLAGRLLLREANEAEFSPSPVKACPDTNKSELWTSPCSTPFQSWNVQDSAETAVGVSKCFFGPSISRLSNRLSR